MYGLKPDEYISKELHRPVASVRKMAETIFPDITRTDAWSQDEIQKLKSYLGICQVEIIARIFGRGVADVESQIAELDSFLSDAAWNQEEIADLKRLYGTRTDRDIARIFGRSEDSISSKALELCLAKDKAFVRRVSSDETRTRMPRWTEEEIEKLKGLYAEHSNLEIAQALNRSVKSVVSKAHIIGLKKDPKRLQVMGRQNVSLRYSRQGDAAGSSSMAQAAGASGEESLAQPEAGSETSTGSTLEGSIHEEGTAGGALSSSADEGSSTDEGAGTEGDRPHGADGGAPDPN
jgi:hypothetical protein